MIWRTTRRRMLQVLAASAVLPLGAFGLRQIRGKPEPIQWHGEALGALSSLTLWHPDPRHAQRAINQLRVEIDRQDRIFSLYRADSEIARLNQAGHLAYPSLDFLEVLDQSRQFAQISNGAFDPTIQPLWTYFANQPTTSQTPQALAQALSRVDYTALTAHRTAVTLGRPGMGLSLNGIAQGYITDRITDILRNEGFDHAVIELGETRALGAAPDGRPFDIGLVDPAAPGLVDHTVALSDAALAVSGGYGMRLGTHAGHHIFDPRTGFSPNSLSRVAVIAPRAISADALSTAIYVAGEQNARALLSFVPGATAILTRSETGETINL